MSTGALGEPLGVVAGLLGRGGARVRAAYPGVWLRDDVYATHGHYLDRHTTAPGFERLGAGLMSKLLKVREGEMRSPDDYERILSPIYAWMLAISERGGPELDGADGGTSSKVLRRIREGGVRGNGLRFGVNAAAWILGGPDSANSAVTSPERRCVGPNCAASGPRWPISALRPIT